MAGHLGLENSVVNNVYAPQIQAIIAKWHQDTCSDLLWFSSSSIKFMDSATLMPAHWLWCYWNSESFHTFFFLHLDAWLICIWGLDTSLVLCVPLVFTGRMWISWALKNSSLLFLPYQGREGMGWKWDGKWASIYTESPPSEQSHLVIAWMLTVPGSI